MAAVTSARPYEWTKAVVKACWIFYVVHFSPISNHLYVVYRIPVNSIYFKKCENSVDPDQLVSLKHSTNLNVYCCFFLQEDTMYVWV